MKYPKAPHSFHSCLLVISNHFPGEARTMFTEIQKGYPELVPESIYLINNQYTDESYYYATLNWLWERKEKYMDSFFWLLSFGRGRDFIFYKESDLDYYEYLVNNITVLPKFCDYINYNLIDYVYINKERTFRLLEMYLKSSHFKDWGHLLYCVFDNEKKYVIDFKNDIRLLFTENIAKIDLEDFHTKYLLNFLEDTFGFDALFNFVDKSIEETIKQNEYKYYDFERNFYLSGSLTEEQKVTRFMRVMEWYINHEPDNPKKQKYLLEFFRPGVILTSETANALSNLITSCKNYNELFTIAKGLQSFHNNTPEWINTMASIADLMLAYQDKKTDLKEVFGSSFYYNNGSKSKTGRGIPYNQDIARKGLLEQILKENKFSESVIVFLNKCLQKVNADIETEIMSDVIESGW